MSPAFAWPAGVQCAVSLTYDDGLPIHPSQVGPTLEQYGLRGTFYPPTLSDLRHHPEAWRRLAAADGGVAARIAIGPFSPTIDEREH